MKRLLIIYKFPMGILLAAYMIILVFINKMDDVEFVNFATVGKRYILLGSTLFWLSIIYGIILFNK